MGLKSTGTNVLYIRGSRGDSNLKSIPVSELVLDELDEMDTKAIWLALERLSGQIEKHVVAISTPTVPKYGIHKLFLTSTQEHFYFKCPHCGRSTELLWPDCVEIIGETVSDPRCVESFIKCKECKHKLDHKAKTEFLSGGVWQPTNPQADPRESRGFYANQLYSSTVTPGEIVIAHFRGQGDEAANKEFNNSKVGIPFPWRGARRSPMRCWTLPCGSTRRATCGRRSADDAGSRWAWTRARPATSPSSSGHSTATAVWTSTSRRSASCSGTASSAKRIGPMSAS